MNEKGRQTKLLAAIAVLAMVVCAFAVVMPSEDVSGAAPTAGSDITGTLVTANTEVTTLADGNYIVGDVPLTIEATITGDDNNALYLLPGATITINAGTVGSAVIMIYDLVSDGANTPTYKTNANGITIPASAEIATGGVTITNDVTNGMTISGAVTSGNITMTNVTVGEDGFLDSDDTTANAGLDYAYATLVTGGGITYSATTENVVFEDNNDTKVDAVIVKSPSATMTVTYNYGDVDAAKTTVIAFSTDLATTAGITITGSTTAATAPTIGGSYTAGSITMQSGSATIATSLTAPNGGFNAFADKALASGAVVGATVSDLAATIPATVNVYGNVQANQSMVNDSPVSVVIQAGSSVQNFTVATTSTTIGVFSLINNGTTAITVSLSSTAITVPGITTGVSMTLVSGTFTATTLSVAAESTLTVANGATLTVPATGTIAGNFYIAGALATATTSTITISETGRFIAMGGATVPTDKITISGDGYIDFSGMAGTENVSGSITGSRDYGQAQNVNVIGNWEVKNNAYVIIRGDFIVNENVTVTIRAGSQIVIIGDTSKMNISGTLNIEAGASFIVVKSENTEISGTVNNNGAFYINMGTVEILEGGVVNSRGVSTDGYTYIVPSVVPTQTPAITMVAGITTIDGFAVANGANLNVYGDFNIAKISNKGTITFDNATAKAASDITLAGNGAVVYIESVGGLNASGTAIDLSITDGTNSITFADGNGADANLVQIADITITGFVTVKDGKNVYALDISGAPEVSYDGTTTTTPPTVNATLTVTGTKVTVTETLALGENVTLNINGVTEVSGTVTAMDNSSIIAVGNTGALTVTGMIQSRGTIGITSPGVVNAAHYTAKADNVTYNYYTTLATAIANEAKEIDILGTVTVIENLDIPAGVTVNAGNGLTIGDDDHRDITVTVKDGATLNGTNVTVDATLEFEDKTDNYVNTINSDVAGVGDVSSMYTNIYTALLGADEGDVVTVTKPVAEGAVILTSDLTVPAGVTLEVPISRTIQVNDGVTLTVDGTMRTTALLTEGNHGFSAVASEDKARLIVNGTFMSMDAVDYATYQAAGAYYAVTGSTYNYLTTVPLAAATQNVSAGVIDIYGDVTVDTITFTGTEEQALTVTLKDGSMVATTVTLSRTTFGVNAGAEFEGTVASAGGSIKIVNSGSFTVADTVDDEDVETFSINGFPVKADANGVDATIAIATGNVSVIGILNVTGLEEFSIDSGATLTVTGQDGRFTASKMTIDGTLVSTDYGRVTVTDLIVMGTFTVEPSTTENGAGSATITNLYIGTSDKTEGNAAAAVNGTFTPSKAVVAAAATVDEKIVENLRNSTEIYVEGELYATAYASASNTYVDLSKVAVENADVVGWAETEGGETLLNGATSFSIGTYDDLYAIIDYNIYDVYVVAGNGIGTVAIDNIVLVKGAGEGANYYTVLGGLKAGTHTITYTLQTGYEGISQITVNGTLQTGNTFECSGTDTADRNIYINLSDVTPVDISTGGSTSGGDGDSLGLTDYLLIILVVLIVVMAIMVALRLMRS